MSKTILVVSSDIPLLPNRAVTGMGVRMHGIISGLKKAGFDIAYTISENRVKWEDNLPEEFTKTPYSPGNLRQVIGRIAPDIVLKTWWGGEDSQLEGLAMPVVFDLPAPKLLEEVYHGQTPEGMFKNKIRSLSAGDYFMCSTPLHRAYYLPYLMMAGIDLHQELMVVVPHATTLTPSSTSCSNEFTIVFGGVYWPWQNPLRSLNILIELMDHHKKGVLKLFCGPLPYKNEETRKYNNLLSKLHRSGRVEVSGLLPYQKMREEFCRADLAIDIMDWNIERELSLSFRTMEYLAGGLPVVTGRKGEWGRIIKEAKAGWTVENEDDVEIRKVLEEILLTPESVKERSENAKKLIQDQFSPEKTIEPLCEFLRDPKKRKAKQRTPFTNLLSLEKGRNWRKEKEYKRSADSFKECINKEGRCEWAHLELATTLLQSGKVDLAEKELLCEETYYPGKPETQNILGMVKRRQSKLNEAIEVFSQAILKNPSLEWVHFERGLTFIDLGREKEAIEDINQEEYLYPGKPETLYAFGIIYRKQKKYDEAINILDEAIANTPLREWIYFEKGMVSMERELWEQAEENFNQEEIFFSGKSETKNALGVVFRRQKQHKKAGQFFKEAIKRDPSNDWPYFETGVNYKEMGDSKSALSWFEKALGVNPQNNFSRYNSSSLYKEFGELKKAKTGFETIINNNSASSSLKGGSCFHRGKIALDEGAIKDAIFYFRQCLKAIPNHGAAAKYLRRHSNITSHSDA